MDIARGELLALTRESEDYKALEDTLKAIQ